MRSSPPSRQAAAPHEAGCLPAFIAPLAVILVSCLLAAFALNRPGDVLVLADACDLGSCASTPIPTAAPTSAIAPLFTPEVQHWAASIGLWAANAGVDPNLAATVMQIESCGDPLARSRSNAAGLFQVMPFHFSTGEDPYDPDTNALRGLAYLRRSLDTAAGAPALAFAGYNGGISVISLGQFAWADETVRYVYWGSGIYADAVNAAPASARLQEWLDAGGASLCRQAHARLGLP